MSKNKEQGQALVIVILTMVVALTVGLSVATRSVTTVRISTSEEESQQAFAAAEAGIEEVLKSGVSMASELTLTNNARYLANVVSSPVLTDFLVPQITLKDDVVQIWLSKASDYSGKYSGDLTFFWGDPADSCPDVPALEVILFSGNDINNPTLTRYPIDPCIRGNNFSTASVGGSVGGKSLRNSYSITGVTNGIIARIMPLYKSANIGVRGSNNLPTQGKEVISTGKVTSGIGDVIRKIQVFQSNPTLPSVFDYTIFSGTSL